MSVFKAYDIRGLFGSELDLDTVYRVGRVLPSWMSVRRVVIGRDVRLSSGAVRDALCRGLCDGGCDVDDLGEVSTPTLYYLTRFGRYDASVQITASHNPPEYNGLKISGADLLPVGAATGMASLAARVQQRDLPPLAAARGHVRSVDGISPFHDFLRPHVPDLSGMRVVLDCGGGMAATVLPALLGDAVAWRNTTPDGRFRAHSPNPMEPQSHAHVMADIGRETLDAGLVFDGDADRVVFVDERGRFVRPDLMTGVLAARVLRNCPASGILNDIRTSRGVLEGIVRLGGVWHMGPVGHAFAKPRMRSLGTVLGGELAAHYYFKDFFGCDSGELTALWVLDELARARRNGRNLSDLVAPFAVYANTGERNYRVRNRPRALAAVRDVLLNMAPEQVLECDGIRVEFEDGWVNARISNTEPYLRLIAESREADRLREWIDRLEAVLEPWREA